MKPVTAPTASPRETAATEPRARAGSTRAAGAARDPRLDKARHAASEFESMLVKQLLKAAHIGATAGSEKANGYGDMAVDALASAIEHGGGLGLSNRIQQALHLSAHAGAATALAPAPQGLTGGAGAAVAPSAPMPHAVAGAPAPAQAAGAVLAMPSTTAALPGDAATVSPKEPGAHKVGIPPSAARLKVP
ncbi:MAG: hypothetical protein JOZ69_12090 [Myxococcales bacterium]|nr:hypothetical protein [Myxococcales bacterium]